jgi:ribosomal protein L37AE/L43A
VRKGREMKGSFLGSGRGSLVCPLCEVDKLDARGHSSARCDSCGGIVSGATLEALRQITTLPDALGSHACEECGHPEMRRLPDGTRHCPGCGSEVVPIDARATPSEPDELFDSYMGHRTGSEVRQAKSGPGARARKVGP